MGEFVDGFVRTQLRSGTEAAAAADALGWAPIEPLARVLENSLS